MDIRTPAPKAQAAVDAGSPKEPIHIGKDGRQLRITAKVRRAIDLLATGKCKTQTEAAEQ
jgi:hypothetical protein